ncbi:hypothetical protein [Mucilaginibacter flavus]|uniref:hypothetical protein n=1 Tax=Mucilaginibacter flavus TaxID=931504 RepID=UPI0025B337FB|nr:hypothetical protein [Mucilaginibacter flavus]MDN3581978.1 hypothetical protein [Mucilaginibacter flavus]
MERTEKVSQTKNAFISGIVFGAFMGVFYAFQDDAKTGLICGPISGAVFGVFMYFFTNSKIVKRQTAIDGDMDGVLYSGAANHFINKEAAGGKLYLLNNKLHFKSHRFNIQNHQLDIAITDIAEVGFYNTLGLVPNGLLISTHDGRQEKFVVNYRKIWKQEILKAKI